MGAVREHQNFSLAAKKYICPLFYKISNCEIKEFRNQRIQEFCGQDRA